MRITGANAVQGLDSGEQDYTHVCTTVTSSGSTTIYTPQAGRRLRLHWTYAISDPDGTSNPLIQVYIGPDEKFRAYAISKRQVVTGEIDDSLSITLSKAGSVAVTFLLEEF